MSYSNFTMEDLKTKLGLVFIQDQTLFSETPVSEISEDSRRFLAQYKRLALAINTEKARSDYITAPLMGDLKMQYYNQISLFCDIEFNVDKEQGLSGRCDYIISLSDDQYSLTAPIMTMVEAKNDNIKSGIPQCGAEMVAAQLYNDRKQNTLEIIYGCVTTGTNWKFLKLHGQDFYIDQEEYYADTPEKISGILTAICLEQ